MARGGELKRMSHGRAAACGMITTAWQSEVRSARKAVNFPITG